MLISHLLGKMLSIKVIFYVTLFKLSKYKGDHVLETVWMQLLQVGL